MAIIGIIAAIAVPGLLRARIAGNEASAIGSLRAINSANLNWMTNCAGGAAMRPTLAALGSAADALAVSRSSARIFSSTDTITKSGYDITYAAVGTQADRSDDMLGRDGGSSQGYNALAARLDGEHDGRALLRHEREQLRSSKITDAAPQRSRSPYSRARAQRTARRSSKTCLTCTRQRIGEAAAFAGNPFFINVNPIPHWYGVALVRRQLRRQLSRRALLNG